MDTYNCSFDVGGLTLRGIDHGGDGPLLVLLPGLTANARFFDALVASGLQGHARVVVPDLRGRGRSDKPATGYSVTDHAADVLAVLDRLGAHQAAVGGHSYGGLVSYFLAANHPERVSHCLVLDAPGEVHPGILEQSKPALDRLEAVYPSMEAYMELVRSFPFYQGWWDPRIEAYYEADVEELPSGEVQTRCRPEHIRQVIEGTLTIEWPKLVEQVTCPTLMVRAVDGFGLPGAPPIVGPDVAARTLERLADGTLIDVPGNHMTAFYGESAATVATEIARFVDR